MKTDEKYLERKLNKEVLMRGGLSVKLLGVYHKGLPDRMILTYPGVIRFVEVKTPGKRPTQMQLLTHAAFNELGFKVYIIDSVESLNIFLSDIDNEIYST